MGLLGNRCTLHPQRVYRTRRRDSLDEFKPSGVARLAARCARMRAQ
jgi:hypothetical protein